MYMGDVAKNAPSSTSTNIVRLKSIFFEAINEELILKNPFSKLKLRYRGMSKTPSLTIYQVKAILDNEKIIAEPRLRFYRDMFLFGCFTGLSVSNIISLSNTAIFPMITSGLKLDTSRVKTSELIVQVLPKAAEKIFYRYNGTSRSQTVFPSFSADDFREKLKLIAVLADINVNLTTKLSRTTCNQMLVNVGSFDNIYKRAYMGWSNISSIESIYTTLVDDVLVRNTRNIDEYLLSQLGADLLEKI
jgi:integrase